MKLKAIALCVGLFFMAASPKTADAVFRKDAITNYGLMAHHTEPHGELEESNPYEVELLTEVPTLEEIKSMDLTKPSGVSAEGLKNALLHNLEPLADVYIDQEKDGVNAVFKAAQDALESGWGRYCFKPNNISGFVTRKHFESKEECIYFVSQKLREWYLTEPNGEDTEAGKFYNGNTIYGVSVKYCPIDGASPNYHYGDMIANIMLEIYQRAVV